MFASAPVSQYLFGSTARDSQGNFEIRLKEVFAPNLPLFVDGTAAFIGDYIDMAGQPIVATNDPAQRYKYNIGTACTSSACEKSTTAGASPVFHAAFTDNRDVIPPIDGDWTRPVCLTSGFTGDPANPVTNFGACADPGDAGNRNQNVRTAIVAPDSVAYAYANSKRLSSTRHDRRGDPLGRRPAVALRPPPRRTGRAHRRDSARGAVAHPHPPAGGAAVARRRRPVLGWPGATRLRTVVVLHANHAHELDREVRAACARLAASGATLLNQSVLLRGVNDSADALVALSEALFAAGVLPYYLHQLDLVAGAGHFAVPGAEARALVAVAVERLPGYLVPRLVCEVAGAPRKLPLELALEAGA